MVIPMTSQIRRMVGILGTVVRLNRLPILLGEVSISSARR